MLNAKQLAKLWKTDPRWKGIHRPYSADDVVRLRGTVEIVHTLARRGAEKLWGLFKNESYIPALGAITGNQAVQMVQAGLKVVYVSGWQVAADNNDARETYPDQSLYPADSVPHFLQRINRAFKREDEKQVADAKTKDWFAPLIADAEAGFGGPLNAFELMKKMIEAGVAGVHFEDQLAAAKKCGHLGGKVLVPVRDYIQKLIAARLAADLMNVPTLLIARTDAHSAKLITSDIDPLDRPFIKKQPRTEEGFFALTGGLACAIARALAYAPYADVVWCETSTPSLADATTFAQAIHKKFPGKLLAYNCSPSFNWTAAMDAAAIAAFQQKLGALGYKFQFVTLAGFHLLNLSMFNLASAYAQTGMSAYADIQKAEFQARANGYAATEHQAFVGNDYFEDLSLVISGGKSSAVAMDGSTEKDQFK